jgi:SAM-dependent methyltransferase
MAIELTLPFPDKSDATRRAVWMGTEFAIGSDRERILAYDVGDSGWTDDLTRLHEIVAGSDHFIDVASRAHALDQVTQSVKTTESTVLEVGCSSGFFLRELAARFPGARIIGADYTLSTLRVLAPTIPGIPLVRFDLTRCPLPDDFVDTAILINVLEHIDDDEAAVRHLFRILRPGGRVVIEVPAGPALIDVYDKVLLHHRRYAMSSLVALLTKAGFKIEARSHLGFLLYPAFYISKRLNQFRYGNRSDIDEEKIVASMISSTGRASRPMRYLMAAENFLRRYFYLPVGIRCLVTCSKPG